MNEKASLLAFLFSKKLKGTLTEEEQILLTTFINENEELAGLSNQIETSDFLMDELRTLESINIPNVNLLFGKGKKETSIPFLYSIRKWLPYVAASVLIFLSFFYVFIIQQDSEANLLNANSLSLGSGGVIVLSNGQVIKLSDSQDGISIDNNSIQYSDGSNLIELDDVSEATIQIPRGKSYKLTLIDGTVVWLNADSKMTYPIRFNTATRRVRLEGEAYFNVAKNSHKPFIVEFDSSKVEVLGTSFNISCYPDNNITQTTLIEGSVRLHHGDRSSKVLKPNEQAVISNKGIHIRLVQPQQFVLWKEGVILLDRQSLGQIIPQLERWYDVKFEFKQPYNSQQTLSGEIPSDTPLNSVLEVLTEQLKIKFVNEGRRIIVEI